MQTEISHRITQCSKTYVISVFLFILTPHITFSHSTYRLSPFRGSGAIHPTFTAVKNAAPEENTASCREQRCLTAGKWVGVAAGSFMGVAHICWTMYDVSGIHGSFGKNIATAVPSAFVGGYVGSKTTPWMTKQIMRGNPGRGRAALRGAGYGALNGAIILSSSMIPLFLMGHALDTIHFNTSEEMIELKLIGISVLGGIAFGGMYGAIIGTAYGTGISLYMRY